MTTIICQGTSKAKIIVLKYKPRNIQMGKSKPIVSYLTKFTQVKDELAGVGETTLEADLVSLALLGLHKSWDNFQDAVSGREKFPD